MANNNVDNKTSEIALFNTIALPDHSCYKPPTQIFFMGICKKVIKPSIVRLPKPIF